MSKEQNIKAILETHFAGFKDELIDSAVESIMRLEPNSPDLCCGYPTAELVAFAITCRSQGVEEPDLHDFVSNFSLAFQLGYEAYREECEKSIRQILGKAKDE